jgi:hypothetical protein
MTPLRIRGLLLAAALMSLYLLLAGTAVAAPIKLGAYYCPTTPCVSTEAGSLNAYKTVFGRYPAIALNYRDLDLPLLYSGERTALKERGVVPMMTVEPIVEIEGKEVSASLEAVKKGEYDADIRSEAKEAVAYGGEVLLRFAHEMNGTWYAWSGNPTLYKEAWKHYVGIFREEKATNVKFVWSPNVSDGGTYPFAEYFPGDEWVDYVALDGYNWGGSEWRSLSTAFKSSYDELTTMSTKPVVIAETASTEGSGASEKATWIRQGLLKAIPETMPKVAAVVWFSRDLSGAGQRDWRIETSTQATEAWKEVSENSLYGGSVYDLRPNATLSSENPWTVVGAASAWDALNDWGTEAMTPDTANYITATTVSGSPVYTTDVDLETTSLTGKTIKSASVRYYTSVAPGETVEARSGTTSLASQTAITSGWHSLTLTLSGSQSQLDGLYLRFKPNAELGSRRVSSAFLRLALSP